MNANVASYLLYEIIQQVSVEIIYQSFCLQLVSAALKWPKNLIMQSKGGKVNVLWKKIKHFNGI